MTVLGPASPGSFRFQNQGTATLDAGASRCDGADEPARTSSCRDECCGRWWRGSAGIPAWAGMTRDSRGLRTERRLERRNEVADLGQERRRPGVAFHQFDDRRADDDAVCELADRCCVLRG